MFNEGQELGDFKQKLTKCVDFTREDLQSLRTGKSSPSLVENMMVETYGGTTKLKLQELATTSSEGPSGLLINPFDPSTITDIEKAILNSPLHLTPLVDGKMIHLKIPPITEEQRKQILKIVGQKIEEGKAKLRMSRDEIRRKTKQYFEDKALSEDQKYRIEKEIDKVTQEYSLQLETIRDKKEKELMNI